MNCPGGTPKTRWPRFTQNHLIAFGEIPFPMDHAWRPVEGSHAHNTRLSPACTGDDCAAALKRMTAKLRRPVGSRFMLFFISVTTACTQRPGLLRQSFSRALLFDAIRRELNLTGGIAHAQQGVQHYYTYESRVCACAERTDAAARAARSPCRAHVTCTSRLRQRQPFSRKLLSKQLKPNSFVTRTHSWQ
jgi:hypothetical protein